MKPRLIQEWQGNQLGWKCVGGMVAWSEYPETAYISWFKAMLQMPEEVKLEWLEPMKVRWARRGWFEKGEITPKGWAL